MTSNTYDLVYKQLNARQKQAVDLIDGPLMVVAGPGTGKTQLLSARVANILLTTDVNPNNILCITFTDNASRNMRERLEIIIGQSAYHVAIHTFHSFGSEVISNSPDHFTTRALLQQTDQLGVFQIMYEIFETLPHSNPLSVKVGDKYILLKDALSIISWLKQNALSPDEFKLIIDDNSKVIDRISSEITETFAQTPSPKLLPEYEQLIRNIENLSSDKNLFGFVDLATLCSNELRSAIEQTDASSRYAPAITAWRNSWCVKDADGKHVLKESGKNQTKLYAVCEVYKRLLYEMSQLGLYDFDDMIMEAVHALEIFDDLRLTLQERYQYILVDEFQDTNKAQLRMLEALGNNPINEDRPNIMVVGDDDQAIYSFQGADTSNMAYFVNKFKSPVITLADSYRSAEIILDASYRVISNLTDRLSIEGGAKKNLVSKANYTNISAAHKVFGSELAQYQWIADQTAQMINNGTKPKDIAVVAPRHRYLERLMPFLGQKNIPVSYERRENILNSPLIMQLIAMVDLVVSLSRNQHEKADELLCRILGYEFWGINNKELIEISLEAYANNKRWIDIIGNKPKSKANAIMDWFYTLSRQSSSEPIEYLLDKLIGTDKDEPDSFKSPMREHYFGNPTDESRTSNYLDLLGQLSTLRQHIRSWKPQTTIFANDFMEFTSLHKSSDIELIDTNPHTQTTNAVQVMTAYKAKGLEFDCVFVINSQDEVWGPTARSKSSSISLPKNLPLAPPKNSDNDKMRLFFVALTRAKHTLYITSYTHDRANKLSPGLSYIGGNQSESTPVHSLFKPENVDMPNISDAVDILSTDWQYRFRQVIADTPDLFEPILRSYKLSVTHLNNFIDVTSGGPEYFLTHNLLRFPEAPSPAASYGDAVHKTLQWIYTELRTSKLPKITVAQDYFLDVLSRKHLRSKDFKRLAKRGEKSITRYMEERSGNFDTKDLIEKGFSNEGSKLGNAVLSGKLDKIHFIDSRNMSVIDFKTGKPANSWQGKDDYEQVKLHKYKQQLLFYKLLVEHSASYANKFTVQKGELEFIEPNDNDKLVDNLALNFEASEVEAFGQLIQIVWQHIQDLNFPDVNNYPKNLKGIKQFEQDLLDKKI